MPQAAAGTSVSEVCTSLLLRHNQTVACVNWPTTSKLKRLINTNAKREIENEQV